METGKNLSLLGINYSLPFLSESHFCLRHWWMTLNANTLLLMFLTNGSAHSGLNHCDLRTAIWQPRSVSTLAQVTACCLTTPSDYLNQCWLIASEVLWYSPEGNITRNAQDIYPRYAFENHSFKITASFPRSQWINISVHPRYNLYNIMRHLNDNGIDIYGHG